MKTKDSVDGRSAPGSPRRVVRLGRLVLLWRPRSLLVTVLLAVLAFVAFSAVIAVGDFPISLPRVVEVLFGGGDRLDRVVVLRWRLSRALLALAVGLALGLAGALTQSLARNPLVSPDVLGVSDGASAAVVAFFVYGTALASGPGPAGIAFVGGITAAVAVYLLAFRQRLDPLRLVLVGIGVSAMLQSIIVYLLVSADLATVARAKLWLTGSLDGRGYAELWPVLAVLVVAAVVGPMVDFRMEVMMLGDDVAAGLGVRLERVRTVMLVLAVALVAVAVAAVGPIAFVALVAPQVAQRLYRAPRPPLLGGGLVGALLVLGADVIARSMLPWALPVGVVTAAVGGPFLLYLIIRQRRVGRV